MKNLVSIINKLISLLPGDGKKTLSGLKLTGLGLAIYLARIALAKFGYELPETVTPETIPFLIESLQIALQHVSEGLMAVGISIGSLGAVHKVAKVADKKFNGKNSQF